MGLTRAKLLVTPICPVTPPPHQPLMPEVFPVVMILKTSITGAATLHGELAQPDKSTALHNLL